ncbi:hypothetical protein IQ289_11705 [Burkholderia sp. R-70006]|uniref:hypothetical protein n=1 Tax=Paraburkholderia domus TaxID=2793075 RepID=UPI001914AABE|nr:hypothetical protein [Paraburkholderia domus]MBK5049067.1 hypothetical protein [Burkholderia sp. R-70006]
MNDFHVVVFSKRTIPLNPIERTQPPLRLFFSIGKSASIQAGSMPVAHFQKNVGRFLELPEKSHTARSFPSLNAPLHVNCYVT